MASRRKYDRERDPAVIELRHKLFKELVEPNFKFVDYLCAKYVLNKTKETFNEFRFLCLTHLYRNIESFDPSKYTKENKEKALQNWIHIVLKRFIHNYEERLWREDNNRGDNVDVDELLCVDEDNQSFEDTENIRSVVTLDNYKELFSDEMLEAYESLNQLQKDAFILQHHGMSIAEIRERAVRLGQMSPNSGCDAVKKSMQRGRVIIRNSLLGNEGRGVTGSESAVQNNVQSHDPEGEFKLELRAPRQRND